MYVDMLPQMPKVFGYSIKYGRPTRVHLTIGMYQKKWKFHRDLPATTVFVFGTSAASATSPDPTIEGLQGALLWVTWENHLPDRHILPWDPTVPTAIPSCLPRPVAVTHFLVAVAETFDVVVDFAESETAETEQVNTAPYPYPAGDAPNHLNSKVMKFVVETTKTTTWEDDSTVPARLLEYVVKVGEEEEEARKRYIVMYEYNDAATEVWEVINLTPDNHPLHFHLAAFQAVRAVELVDRNEFARCMAWLNDAAGCDLERHVAGGEAVAVPVHERTWKNVVKVAPGHVTTVVVKFLMVDTGRTYPFDAMAEPGYVYHCHILDHEDNAMIRPLKLMK